MGGSYAHEYLENPSFLSSLAEYVQGFTRLEEKKWPNDHYAFKRDQVHEVLGRTLAHLTAGRLHLFNRRKQFEDRPDLKELFDKIDQEQLPEVYKKKGISLEYWL